MVSESAGNRTRYPSRDLDPPHRVEVHKPQSDRTSAVRSPVKEAIDDPVDSREDGSVLAGKKNSEKRKEEVNDAKPSDPQSMSKENQSPRKVEPSASKSRLLRRASPGSTYNPSGLPRRRVLREQDSTNSSRERQLHPSGSNSPSSLRSNSNSPPPQQRGNLFLPNPEAGRLSPLSSHSELRRAHSFQVPSPTNQEHNTNSRQQGLFASSPPIDRTKSDRSIQPAHPEPIPGRFWRRKGSSTSKGSLSRWSPPWGSPSVKGSFLRDDSRRSKGAARKSQSPPGSFGSFSFPSSGSFRFTPPNMFGELSSPTHGKPSSFLLEHVIRYNPVSQTGIDERRVKPGQQNSNPLPLGKATPLSKDPRILRKSKSFTPPGIGIMSQPLGRIYRSSSGSVRGIRERLTKFDMWDPFHQSAQLERVPRTRSTLPRIAGSSNLSLKSLVHRAKPTLPGKPTEKMTTSRNRVRHYWELDPREGFLSKEAARKRRASLKQIAKENTSTRPYIYGMPNVEREESLTTHAGKEKGTISEMGSLINVRDAIRREKLKQKDRKQKEEWMRQIDSMKRKRYLDNLKKRRDEALLRAQTLHRIGVGDSRSSNSEARQKAIEGYEHLSRIYRKANKQHEAAPRPRPILQFGKGLASKVRDRGTAALKSSADRMRRMGRRINNLGSTLNNDLTKAVKGCCPLRHTPVRPASRGSGHQAGGPSTSARANNGLHFPETYIVGGPKTPEYHARNSFGEGTSKMPLPRDNEPGSGSSSSKSEILPAEFGRGSSSTPPTGRAQKDCRVAIAA